MEKLLSYVLVVLISATGVCSLVWPNSNVTAVLCGLMFCIGVFYTMSASSSKKFPFPDNAVKTPCDIVYMAADGEKASLFTLPYLDFYRRDNVWGIMVNGVIVQATDAPETDLEKARDYVKKTSKAYLQPIGLPSRWQAMHLMAGRDKFERTVGILTECGIEAEGFSFGFYWCDYVEPTLAYLNDKKWQERLLSPFIYTKNPQHANHVRLVVK